MRSKGIYFICTFLLALLVLSAFFAPSIIVKLHDESFFQTISLEEREGIDYAALDIKYEKNLQSRLSLFATGLNQGRQYYITSSDSQKVFENELYLQNIFEQEIFDMLEMNGLFYWSDSMFGIADVTDWDNYVIYDDNMTGGAAFLCWYLEIATDEMVIRLLCDAVDYSVYYLECYHSFIDKQYYVAKKYPLMTYLADGVSFMADYYGAETENVYISKDYVLTDRNELYYDLAYGAEKLRIVATILEPENATANKASGYGIGIEELRKLLPDEKKGSKRN